MKSTRNHFKIDTAKVSSKNTRGANSSIVCVLSVHGGEDVILYSHVNSLLEQDGLLAL